MNFDNVANAFLTLFIMMTGDDWNTVMWDGIDSTEIGQQPKKNNGFAFRYFFIMYMIVGAIFV